MVLEWAPEEAILLQDRPFSVASREAWEPPDIFQHQSTGYLRTRGQETLYETCACVIHTNCMCIIIPLYETLQDRPFSVTSDQRLRTTLHFLTGYTRAGDLMRSECIKLVLVSFTLI